MTTTQRSTDAAPCKAKCAGGRKCVCVGHTHTHHICNHANCACHQPSGYGLEEAKGAHGVPVYVPRGTMVQP